MAAYASVAEVGAEFKNTTFTSTSAVKDSQVSAMLDQATAYIDGKVGMRYVLPIVAPGALLVLKGICIDIVAQRLKPILKIDAGGVKGNQSPATEDRNKKAEQALSDIQSNNTDLTVFGAVLKSKGDGADSYGARNPGDAQFKKGTTQW